MEHFLGTFWAEFDRNTRLRKDALRMIGENIDNGARPFRAHRDWEAHTGTS